MTRELWEQSCRGARGMGREKKKGGERVGGRRVSGVGVHDMWTP